jgi:CHAT domain-containing protein
LSELPGTKVEVEKISEILNPAGMQVNKFLSNQALESKIKSLESPKVLHIATHGFFLSDTDLREEEDFTSTTERAFTNPLLRSGILLAGANKTFNEGGNYNLPEDGVLTAYEAMLLNLSNTDLVILSACETGLGEERNGEGVFGLQRAFSMAGSKNMLMSLWKVSDAGTQELMTLFYKHWITDKNTASAFQKAQLEMMKKNPNPYIWAAFVCVGY